MLETTGRFDIRSRLGAGSFGVVYEAFDHERNRLVALKFLEQVSPDALARFKREFRLLAEIRHPNLASMYELLVLAEQWVLSMEIVRGSDLLEHLAFAELQQSFVDGDDTMNLRRSARLSAIYIQHVRETFRQLATAIAVLHAHDDVHRDVKPSNIMITPDGRVVLLDFGLVTVVSGDDTLDRKIVVGTPGYMSPEQITASGSGMASDWYSFGVILFQALTGRMPFTEIHEQVREAPPRPESIVPSVPRDLADLAWELLHPDPERRPGGEEILRRLGIESVDHPERSHDRARKLSGRSRELRSLKKAIGSAPLVLLHGAPGIGKSALVDRLLDDLREEGRAFLLGGRCGAWESVPFNAVDTIVDSLARTLRNERAAGAEEVLRHSVAVTRLFPALGFAGATSDDATLVVPRSGEKLLARATAELRSLLLAAAGARPIVIVLDDAQWGDYQSAQVLLQMPATLVLVYRTDDWRTSLLLQTVINSDVRRLEIELPPLQRLPRQSAGNPVLAEMIREARRPHLSEAVSLRLRRLSMPAQRLFEFLLTADGPVEESDLERRLELFEIDEPLRTLSRARLIRSRRTGNIHEIDVYHPKMRETAVNR